MGRRRAIVLGIVQLLIVIHLIQWLITGTTTTPIEPSESMEFVKHGVVNVGLIFFALALLATMVLGRWMCGWGCHIIMLQDLCGWIMRRMGVRPKPFRSRLLILVPLLLGLYMFVWPAVFRWGVLPGDAWMSSRLGDGHWVVRGYRSAFAFGGVQVPQSRPASWRLHTELTTDDFWRTMPGVFVAVPFLAICGFGCVYFLGSKGYCTYGCPYGGLFAPLDKLAIGRIRVSDKCRQNAHCSAVCTSNVRVAEEVNAYGMVVDPGCMKCMDCVSACPTGALSFGIGKPAIFKGRARADAALPVRGRPRDLSWRDELFVAAVFIVAFFGSHGVYGSGMLPMLMASGIAGCVCFLGWTGLRLVRDANVSFQHRRLKYRGSLQRSGWIVLTIAALSLALSLHGFVVKATKTLAGYYDGTVTVARDDVYAAQRVEIPKDMQRNAARADGLLRFASSIGAGGIGLLSSDQLAIDVRRIWLMSVQGDWTNAQEVLRDAERRHGWHPALGSARGLLLRAQGRFDEAIEHYRETLIAHENANLLLDDLVGWARQGDPIDEAVSIAERRMERFPDNLPAMRWVSLLWLETGRVAQGIELVRTTITIDPHSEAAYRVLALALESHGELDAAEQAYQDGLQQLPNSRLLLRDYANHLNARGRIDEAREMMQRARDLDH